VRTIELLGAVGSGKSTLAPLIVEQLVAQGIDAVLATDALTSVRGGRRRRLVDLPAGFAFAVRRPHLVLIVVRSLTRSPIDSSHRRRILGLVLRLGARLRFLAARIDPERTVVLDEGFAQRAANVFGWRFSPPSDGELAAYLRAVPLGESVVVVRTPAAEAARRAHARGLPERVGGKAPAEGARFLTNVEALVERIALGLRAQGAEVIEVDNGGEPESAAAAVRLAARHAQSTPRPNLRSLPRPRRPQTPRSISEAERQALGEACAALGLREAELVGPLGVATGRSGAMLVSTLDGPMLVKRYKSTVDLEQVKVEHAVLRELARCRFPAPRLATDGDGPTWAAAGGRTYAAFRFEPGYRRVDDRMTAPWRWGDETRAHGALLGTLHHTLAGFVPPAAGPLGFPDHVGRRARDLPWHLALLDAAGRSGPRDLVTEIRGRLIDVDAELAGMALPRTVIHGDFGPYNLLVRGSAPVLVVDFELTRLDWRVADLATALPRFVRPLPIGRRRSLAAFLAGYRGRSALTEAELRSIPTVLAFLSLRRAAVCLGRDAERPSDALRAEARAKVEIARRALDRTDPIAQVADAA
jgi:Ser/Thr protein kinase RdoA (MazF antagonist)